MNWKYLHICALVCALYLLAGCSTTKNLPEGEVLYTGVKEIDYADQVAKKKTRRDSTGVITAVAEAYNAVDNLLTSKDLSGVQEALKPKQEDGHLTKAQKAEKKRLETVDKRAFDAASEEVDATLNCLPNNSLLGSAKYRSPLPTGLWLYNGLVDKTGKFSKWMFKTFAATPVTLDVANPQLRATAATNTLHNYGYFNGQVDYEVLPQKNPRKAKVSYTVVTRDVYRLDSIAYLNFPPVADSLIRASWSKRLLHKGEPFNVPNLEAERERINALFRNNGYYFYSPEYTQFLADTVARKGHVQMQVMPLASRPSFVRRRWYIGNTTINVYKNRRDTLVHKHQRGSYTYYYQTKKMPVRMGVFRRNLMHKGAMFQLDEQSRSVENLNGLGIFSTLDISYTPRDTTETCDTLDMSVLAMLDKPYDAEFEMNVTSKSNDQLGPGLSFGLSKRNVFHGGEKVSFKVHGSYEWQTKTTNVEDRSLLNSYEYGASLSFDFPRLYFPWLKSRRFRRLGTTTFALDANWKTRAKYFSMVSLGASATYTFYSPLTWKHEIVPFSLSYDELVRLTPEFNAIIEETPSLYVSMRDQFIPAMKYTATYSSPASVRNPNWWQTMIMESGNIASCLSAVGGHPFTKKDKDLFDNPFAQFIKFTTEYRKTLNFGRKQQLAMRVMGGFIYSYGNSTVPPYSEQFYAGGANGVRAFAVRSIGPGSYHPEKSKYSYLDETGDLKLEANIEYRFPILGNIYGATFLDAGNVWLLQNSESLSGGQFKFSSFGKDIALGTGFGLRYDLEFLVLRLDLGIGLHAPYDTGKGGYYNIPKFRDGLGLHFAVGYPF